MRRLATLVVLFELGLIFLPELTRHFPREDSFQGCFLSRRMGKLPAGIRTASIDANAVRKQYEGTQAFDPSDGAPFKVSRAAAASYAAYIRRGTSTPIKTELLAYERLGIQPENRAIFFVPILARFGVRIHDEGGHFINAWNAGYIFSFSRRLYLTASDSGVGFLINLN